jgi:cytoskeletal protein CcmA (bactofilin family)
MFNLGKKPGPSRHSADLICTLLGEGTRWQGEIHAGPNGLRVEGTVEGTILSEGQVVVAPTGVVKGTVQAKHLTVTGRVEGVIKVSGCLEILGTGWVEGEVEMGSLVVDEGGVIQGSCQLPARAKQVEPVPLVPRRDERVPERFIPGSAVGSGTHGAAPDLVPVNRNLDRGRFLVPTRSETTPASGFERLRPESFGRSS